MEGPLPNDSHTPPRFYAFRSDEEIQRYVSEYFDRLDFRHIATGGDYDFQSLTLRRPSTMDERRSG